MGHDTRIAVDVAKAVFEVAISDRPGHVVRRERPTRDYHVRPYVRGNKTDRTDTFHPRSCSRSRRDGETGRIGAGKAEHKCGLRGRCHRFACRRADSVMARDPRGSRPRGRRYVSSPPRFTTTQRQRTAPGTVRQERTAARRCLATTTPRFHLTGGVQIPIVRRLVTSYQTGSPKPSLQQGTECQQHPVARPSPGGLWAPAGTCQARPQARTECQTAASGRSSSGNGPLRRPPAPRRTRFAGHRSSEVHLGGSGPG